MASGGERLARYIRSLEGFNFVGHVDCCHDHMGAAITGAVLQSGLSYAVVRPRVERVMGYPEARTTSGYLQLLDAAGPKALLRWKSDVKPGRAVSLARFFRDQGVETEKDLAGWLNDPTHITELKQLKGIGDKTVDYLRIMAGIEACAVDRHVFSFLAGAGIKVKGYQEASAIVHEAAEIMGVGVTCLDHGIWEHMSGRKAGPGHTTGKKKQSPVKPGKSRSC